MSLERDLWLNFDGTLSRFENDEDTGEKVSLLTLLDSTCQTHFQFTELQRQDAIEDLTQLRAILVLALSRIDIEINKCVNSPLDRADQILKALGA